jgi:hypothetical protein
MDTSRFSGQLRQWIDEVSTNLPPLSRPQVKSLAAWSLAATVEKNCSLTKASLFLAPLFGQSPNTVRQRLRELYLPAERKRGESRRDLPVEQVFAPLLRWVLRLWPADRLPLAIDPTLSRDRMAALVISVPFRGAAVPVAWTMRQANCKGAWMPRLLQLLGRLAPAIPDSTEVLVMADRGLYSKDLFEAIQNQGWHPLLRIPRKGYFRPEDAGNQDSDRSKCQERPNPGRRNPNRKWREVSRLLPRPGLCYRGRVQMFKTPSKRLECTLLAGWTDDQDEPWILLTDLPPEACETGWYGVRSWIEHGFCLLKSLGLEWERARIEDPDRSQRRWLVVALACLYAQATGSYLEDRATSQQGGDGQTSGEQRPNKTTGPSCSILPAMLQHYDLYTAEGRRKVRVFQLGALWIKMALIGSASLPPLRPIKVDPLPVLEGLIPIKPVLEAPL